MADKGMKEQLKAIMDKAARSLEAAESLLNEGNCDFSSSRSYYSAFYVLQALLLTKGLSYSKHAGVISGFSEHFIRTGVFPKEYAKYMARLFRERHTGDYDFSKTISSEEAAIDLKIAGELINSVKLYLHDQGLLGE